MITIKLNGKEIVTQEGKTILDIAKEQNIHIPTLCHDPELHPYGSCWVCAVEVKGRKGFVTACGTNITAGMEIYTDTEAVHSARKMALELLLSDHYADCEAPCKLACPDHVDVQTYVSLIANGQYHEAVRVIKEKLPLPLSIGRVCPAFCEEECRRQIVDEPIAIRQLKHHTADIDSQDIWSYTPLCEPDTGKKIAIIGAGPSGLACGYYLRLQGHQVDIFESETKAGGWLRYGIPEYRLPKAVLDREIALLCQTGMQIHYNQELGKELALEKLSQEYDAVYLAFGAQKAVPMPVKGGEIAGSYLGVDFLRMVANNTVPEIGKRVAVIGGGNTAIDCARTALRLGAEVSLFYRRTRDEMPAESYEIDAALEEGVIMHFLTNPVEYIGTDKLAEIKVETMKLGEPDASGRRKPEATGEYQILPFDCAIAAISQVPEVSMFQKAENTIAGSSIELTPWSTVRAQEHSLHTGIGNIFAGGDLRRGPATAIEAVADGRLAAEAIHHFILEGTLPIKQERFISRKAQKVHEIAKKEYVQYESKARINMQHLEATSAAKSFDEVEKAYREDEAKQEADRCLECGCHVGESCALRKYADDYQIDANHFQGAHNQHPIDDSHPYIQRDPNKCISCGKCIRTCAQIQGAAVLGYIYRGFATSVAPELGESLTETTCEGCGKCIAVCPVGALTEKNTTYKRNPHLHERTQQHCGLCGTGCEIVIESESGRVIEISTPGQKPYLFQQEESIPAFNGMNLCFAGRFGWQNLSTEKRLTSPMIKQGNQWIPVQWNEVANHIAKGMKNSSARRVIGSPSITCEEWLLLADVAYNMEAQLSTDGYNGSIGDPFWLQSNVRFASLEDADTIVLIGKVSMTLRTLSRLQQLKGKKLILVKPEEKRFNQLADEVIHSMDELLEKVPQNGKTYLFYNLQYLQEQEIKLLWQWKASAWIHNAIEIIPTSDWNNLRGFLSLGLEATQSLKGDFELYYGCFPSSPTTGAFRVAVTTQLPSTEESALVDIILPWPTYLEMNGTAIADDGRVVSYHNASRTNWFENWLQVCAALGWIHPSQLEPSVWKNRVEQVLRKAEQVGYNAETLQSYIASYETKNQNHATSYLYGLTTQK